MKRLLTAALPGALLACVACLGRCPQPDRLGEFKGKVQAEWLGDGRTMRLLADFAYIDPGGFRWDALTGSTVDGASIPQALWSIVGGPFEGEYRDASVLHDVACQQKRQPWRKVHEMFYLACLRGGVSELRSKMMYAAVYHFGPRWGSEADLEPETALTSEDDFDRLQMTITTTPQIENREIERLTAPALKRRVPLLPPREAPSDLIQKRLAPALQPDPRRRARPGAQGGVDLLASDEAEKRRIEQRLPGATRVATSSLDGEVRVLEQQIGAERDPQKRAALASRYLQLRRERAALARTNVRVRVEPSPHP